MTSRLLHLLATLSLVLSVAFVALWVRSHRAAETWRREWGDREQSVHCTDYVCSLDGKLWVFRQWRWDPPSPGRAAFHDALDRRRRGRPWHGWEYLPRFSVDPPIADRGWRGAGFFFGRETDPQPGRVAEYRAAAVPYWSLTAVSLFPLPFCLLAWARRARRRRRGRCPSCTYDLTGNVSGVCPECGAAGAAGTA